MDLSYLVGHMPVNIVDFDRESVFASILTSNLSRALTGGLLSPALTALEPSWDEMQREDHLAALHARRLDLPGRPKAAAFVHATLVPATPWGLHVATGHAGVTMRLNRDIVHVQTSPSSLDREGVSYVRIDRSPLSPGVCFALDRTLVLDHRFLRSRDFRLGRNSEFGAGLIVLDSIPPTAIEKLICSDDLARDATAAEVAAVGLSIPVIAERQAYFWPPQQHPPRYPV